MRLSPHIDALLADLSEIAAVGDVPPDDEGPMVGLRAKTTSGDTRIARALS